MAQVQQSPFIAKPGQRWELAQDQVDEFLAQCDSICRLVPQDFEDRVKILHASYAGLMCLTICKIGRQPDTVQLAILKRHNELALSIHPTPLMSLITLDNHEAPLSKPSVEPRHITAEELQLFRNPANLQGKQFILSPNTKEADMYEVTGYSVKRDKTVTYDVLFDDCNPIEVDEQEFMKMLEDSVYLPA